MDKFILIEELMTKNPITVSPNDSLWDVHQIFMNRRFHHVPVAMNGKLLGMISRTDLLKNSPSSRADAAAVEDFLKGIRVDEVMTDHIATLKKTDHLQAAIEVLHENLFHAVMIVDDEKNVEGILTTYDVINFTFPSKL